MKYSKDEVIEYTREEDVKFIRLSFCDVFGRQKNISIMPDELPRAFDCGIAFDASAIAGFGDETHSDLFLHPEAETLTRNRRHARHECERCGKPMSPLETHKNCFSCRKVMCEYAEKRKEAKA